MLACHLLVQCHRLSSSKVTLFTRLSFQAFDSPTLYSAIYVPFQGNYAFSPSLADSFSSDEFPSTFLSRTSKPVPILFLSGEWKIPSIDSSGYEGV